MKSTPTKRRAGRLDVSFHQTPKLRAWPGEEAASARVSCCSGEIMLTTRFGRRISAGRELELGTMLEASFVGAI